MSLTQTPDQPTESPEPLTMAEVHTYKVGLPPTKRCDRCCAQAYVEVELHDKSDLLFCAHHYTEREGKILAVAARVMDHRPFLEEETRLFKGGLAIR